MKQRTQSVLDECLLGLDKCIACARASNAASVSEEFAGGPAEANRFDRGISGTCA
jgi:hypothetical protein